MTKNELMKSTLFKLFILLTIAKYSWCQRSAQRLQRDLFRGYDPASRPVKNSTAVVNVCVGLYILQIVDLSEKNQIIEANIQLLYIWNDNFLQWNASEYENINQLYLKSARIWTPDIVIMDSTEEEQMRGQQSDKYMLIVSSTGKIRWHYQTLSKSLCEIDPYGFPFDEQICSIKVRSWSRDKSMLKIIKRNLKVKVKENIKTEWFIMDSSVKEDSFFINESSRRLEFIVLDYKLTLRRVTTYYFIKIIFPFTIIAFMTLFTFWLAPDSGEKLTLDITVLLSLVFYLQIMSEYIPRGYSRIPLLTLYALGNFIIVLISCVATVFVLRLYYRPPSFLSAKRNQVPYSIRFFVFRILAPICFLKMHFRKKNEDFEETGEFKLKLKQSRKKNGHQKGNKYDLMITLEKMIETQPKSNLISKEEEYEKYGRNLLIGLKSLNKNLACFNPKSTLSKSNSNCLKDQVTKFMYLEEWKQIALVLDRFFFFIFLIVQPLTVLIFLRVNFIDYIMSEGQTGRIANLNC